MINLSSGIFAIKAIHRKTRAAGFAEMQVGDKIRFTMKLSNTTGSSHGGNYATNIVIEDLTRGRRFVKSQSQLLNILRDTFELEAIQQPSISDVLGELEDIVQDMRESGESDLRSVLHQIDRLSRGTN